VKYRFRALLAVGLLVGFYVVALAIVVGLVYAGSLLFGIGVGILPVGLWILAGVVAIAIGKSLLSDQRDADPGSGTLILGEAEQPELWREVRELAQAAATRVPDEIRLSTGANAAVAEETTMLGLVGGTRRMFLGAPLLIGLTRDQLRAVLAHELGHYSGRHTALGPLTYRGKEAIGRVLNDLEDSFVRIPLELYARLYLAISQTVNRRQEFEADRLSAELVGPAVAAEALQQAEALTPAWQFFLDEYVAPGERADCRPRDLFDGFRHFIDDPERQRQLAQVRANLEDPPRSIYDSHPPTEERLAAWRALDAGGGEADTSDPAVTLLSDPQSDLARLGEVLYADSALFPVSFERLVVLAGRADTARSARLFLNALRERDVASPTLGGAVAELKAGGPEALLGMVGDPDADPDAVRRAIAQHLGDAIAHGLLENASATCKLDWSGPSQLVDLTGQQLDSWALAYEGLSGEYDAVEALEAWLDRHAVQRDYELPPIERAADQTPLVPTRWLGVLAVVRRRLLFSRREVFGVADSGVLICRPRSEDHWAATFAMQTFRDDGRTYGKRMLSQAPADVLGEGRARHLPWAEITSIVARNGRHLRRMLITASDGSTVTLRWSTLTYIEGEVWPALAYFLGDRFTVEGRGATKASTNR
jgi:Zn-dependent protease with chaperone function